MHTHTRKRDRDRNRDKEDRNLTEEQPSATVQPRAVALSSAQESRAELSTDHVSRRDSGKPLKV